MHTRAKAKVGKTEADPAKVNGTFDVDESIAASVFSHVKSVRDSLALACVSRVWRRVAAPEDSWGDCDLLLDGTLSERVTDDRF